MTEHGSNSIRFLGDIGSFCGSEDPTLSATAQEFSELQSDGYINIQDITGNDGIMGIRVSGYANTKKSRNARATVFVSPQFRKKETAEAMVDAIGHVKKTDGVSSPSIYDMEVLKREISQHLSSEPEF